MMVSPNASGCACDFAFIVWHDLPMAITDEPRSTNESEIDLTDGPDVAAAVALVRSTFESGRTRPIEWRVEQLQGLVRMLKQDEKRFAEALAADVGKPTVEGFATDIAVTASEIAYVAKHTAKWAKPRKVRLPLNALPGKGSIVPEPLGVALVIAPWNYPVQLLLAPVAAALAAGNAVVAKPSELAPATSALLAELIPRYCDPEAIAVVEGDASVSTALLAEHFDHIFFTGSTRIGQVVMEAAAKHLTPVTLELGGKSPVLVDDSADIEVTGRRLAWGKWLNAGQTCVAPDYVLVTESKRDQLVDAMRNAFLEFSGGDTRNTGDYARIVTERHAVRLQGMLADHGGTIAIGGGAEPEARYVEPTVIVDPDLSSKVMSEEIFGPILPVVTVESMDDAVRFVNDRDKPLALYVFANDDEVVDRIIDETSSGGACINHVVLQLAPPELPFGGVGPSGTGRYHGQSGFDTFSNLRSVLRKGTKPDPKLLYPPYTNFKERVLRRFL